MSLMSSSRFGNRSSDRFRPRAEQASIQIIPLSSSCIPLRMVSRSQPNSRSALRCPPVPIALTARAINRRRVLPFNSLAVSINSDLTSGVSSIFSPPRYRALYGTSLSGRIYFLQVPKRLCAQDSAPAAYATRLAAGCVREWRSDPDPGRFLRSVRRCRRRVCAHCRCMEPSSSSCRYSRDNRDGR
jgi:hypothetical protein